VLGTTAAVSAAEPERAIVTESATRSPALAPRASRVRPGTLAGVAVLVIAAIALPRLMLPIPGAADSNEQPQPAAAAAEIAPSPQPIAPPPARVSPRKLAVAKAPTHRIVESPKSSAPVAATASIGDAAAEKEDSATKVPVSEPMRSAAAPASASAGSVLPSPVTITGCLEISTDDEAFRLTDTKGVDAPKSRSWRTGFLRKRSAAVALVEAPDRLALKTSIGKRVAATGLLTSHELKLNSLRVVGASCN